MAIVSIIMPSYNSEKHIFEAIESVINQDFKDWELLIADDGSKDSTLEIALDFQKIDERIKVFLNKNKKGAAGARNTCLEQSTGRFIAFLDSDDIWLSNKLSLQLDFMMSKSISFSFSYHEVISEFGDRIISYQAPKKVNAFVMKFSNFIPCLTAIYDTRLLGKVEQPYFEKRNDYALWLKILNREDVEFAYCLPVVPAKYRANSYGLSSNKISTLYFFKKCLRDYGNVSPMGAIIFSFFYIFLGVIKSKFTRIYNLIVRNL